MVASGLVYAKKAPIPRRRIILVAGDGFEPPTSRLWAWQATGLLYPARWPNCFGPHNIGLFMEWRKPFRQLLPPKREKTSSKKAKRGGQIEGREDGVIHVEVTVIGEPA